MYWQHLFSGIECHFKVSINKVLLVIQNNLKNSCLLKLKMNRFAEIRLKWRDMNKALQKWIIVTLSKATDVEVSAFSECFMFLIFLISLGFYRISFLSRRIKMWRYAISPPRLRLIDALTTAWDNYQTDRKDNTNTDLIFDTSPPYDIGWGPVIWMLGWIGK